MKIELFLTNQMLRLNECLNVVNIGIFFVLLNERINQCRMITSIGIMRCAVIAQSFLTVSGERDAKYANSVFMSLLPHESYKLQSYHSPSITIRYLVR